MSTSVGNICIRMFWVFYCTSEILVCTVLIISASLFVLMSRSIPHPPFPTFKSFFAVLTYLLFQMDLKITLLGFKQKITEIMIAVALNF